MGTLDATCLRPYTTNESTSACRLDVFRLRCSPSGAYFLLGDCVASISPASKCSSLFDDPTPEPPFDLTLGIMSNDKKMDVDGIEQFTATDPASPLTPADPIEQFSDSAGASNTATSSTPDNAAASSRALAEYFKTGAYPDTEEGKAAKARRTHYDDETAQKALEVLAFKKASEKMGIANLRSTHPGATDEELVRIWTNKLSGVDVDSHGRPTKDADLNLADKCSDESTKRVIEYCQYISAGLDHKIHEKSLDCTFCGAYFPEYFLLCINPDEIADWRDIHYRCCYKCATCHSDDYVWYSEGSGLSPAVIRGRGTLGGHRYDPYDRTTVADYDDDYDHKPAGWHIAVDTRCGQHAKCYFESVWDDHKSRWVRKPRFYINEKLTDDIGIYEFYKLCGKVFSWRKQNYTDQLRDRNSTWKQMCEGVHRERPGASSSDVRRTVRLRLLQLTDIFTADIEGLNAEQRKQVFQAFEQWQTASIAKSIDPNWNGDEFWNMALNDAPLTDWFFKISDRLDQRFICRNRDCTSVIHNHHWLRQVSTEYKLRDQHGRYHCPRCLTPYRPHAVRTNAASLNTKTLVPAQKALIVDSTGRLHDELPAHGQRLHNEDHEYFIYLTQWEKTDDDALIGRLKQIMAAYKADFGTDDFRQRLVCAIRDQNVKYQNLGYFTETTWSEDNMMNILDRNFQTTKKYRPDLLPTEAHPNRPLDETANTQENFQAYGISSFRKDPPFYHFATYDYVEDETVVLTQDDMMRFMALCYIRLRAAQYLNGDRSFLDIDPDHLELIKKMRKDRSKL